MPLRLKCLISLIIALLASIAWIKPIDQSTDAIVTEHLKNAAVTFAAARLLNGAISVVQGTELSIEPVGIGVTFKAGEILDPVNDMVERFSWVMLASTTSLGIQKLLIQMISAHWFNIMLSSMAGLLVIALWIPKAIPRTQLWFTKLFALLIVVRFALTIVVLANHLLQIHFLEEQQQQATEHLQMTTQAIEDFQQQQIEQSQEEKSFIESLRDRWDQVSQQLNPSKQFEVLQAKANQAIEDMMLLIASFLLQTVLLPLLFLWILVKISGFIMRFEALPARTLS
ncbi:hypothetical protein [Zooshikella harenae]|uniref:Uncharacterized protein n=1 Tax=Zooshikella harenae TaxID=2827238 RepID=A0ABS5ZHV1_9GAMM|nr:hypothetical protein [Zooshikella harenae]MBU2713545.1 hypothetical protein [Zooshikella harenae]